MRRLLCTTALVGFMVAIAVAAITWHDGPLFTDNGDGSFTLTGDASGQGNTRLVARIELSASVRYTCENKGGNQAPGQNPVPAGAEGEQDVNPTDHNGRSLVDLTVGPIVVAPTVDGDEAGCPNGNWSGVDPVFEPPDTATATATIFFGGVPIFTQTITYDPTP
jgi:hypothetical protein